MIGNRKSESEKLAQRVERMERVVRGLWAVRRCWTDVELREAIGEVERAVEEMKRENAEKLETNE